MAKRPQFSIPGTKFEKPEKPGWLGPVLLVLFVIFALSVSVWLFHRNGRYHALDCDSSSGMGTLTSWGGCHEGN